MASRDEKWGEYYTVQAEGNRFGVMTCKRCGAAVLVDETHAAKTHERWHEWLDAALQSAVIGQRMTF